MEVQAVNNNHAAKIGKNIGAAAGFSGYVLNIAKKEGLKKDVFIQKGQELATKVGEKFKESGKEFTEAGYNKFLKLGIGVKALNIALVASAFAVGGRIIGGLIGKLIDNHNAKKAEKA